MMMMMSWQEEITRCVPAQIRNHRQFHRESALLYGKTSAQFACEYFTDISFSILFTLRLIQAPWNTWDRTLASSAAILLLCVHTKKYINEKTKEARSFKVDEQRKKKSSTKKKNHHRHSFLFSQCLLSTMMDSRISSDWGTHYASIISSEFNSRMNLRKYVNLPLALVPLTETYEISFYTSNPVLKLRCLANLPLLSVWFHFFFAHTTTKASEYSERIYQRRWKKN